MGPWVIPIATTVGGALINAYLGNEQQKARDKAQAEARRDQALINMYAPLFGHAPQALPMRDTTNLVTPALIQGALSGYQMGAQYQMQDKLNQLYDKQLQDTANPRSSTPMAVLMPHELRSQYGLPASNLYTA